MLGNFKWGLFKASIKVIKKCPLNGPIQYISGQEQRYRYQVLPTGWVRAFKKSSAFVFVLYDPVVVCVPERIYNPSMAMGFLAMFNLHWITLRGKHCRHPIAVMGVVDTFGLCVPAAPTSTKELLDTKQRRTFLLAEVHLTFLLGFFCKLQPKEVLYEASYEASLSRKTRLKLCIVIVWTYSQRDKNEMVWALLMYIVHTWLDLQLWSKAFFTLR